MLVQPWRIDMLGGFCLSSNGQEVLLRSNLLTRLLSYLAIHANRFHPRDELVTLLWPDDDPAVTRARLIVALNSLRHHLEPPGVASGTVLIADRLSVRLNPSAFSADVNRFQAAFVEAFETEESARRLPLLVAAADGYGGMLLPTIDDDWVLGERERLAQSYLQTLHRLVRDLVSVRDYDRALVYARYAVQADNLREEAYRDMMHLFVALGQPLKALQQYQDLKRVLSDALRIAPSAATVQLASQIAERVGLGSPEIVPSPRPPGVIATDRPRVPAVREESGSQGSIPVFLTRFFGRKSELDALEAALQPAGATVKAPAESDFADSRRDKVLLTTEETFAHRLVTLIGPGGTGKTRLAVQAVTRLQPVYDHRICFIPLADIADARRLAADSTRCASGRRSGEALHRNTDGHCGVLQCSTLRGSCSQLPLPFLDNEQQCVRCGLVVPEIGRYSSCVGTGGGARQSPDAGPDAGATGEAFRCPGKPTSGQKPPASLAACDAGMEPSTPLPGSAETVRSGSCRCCSSWRSS